MRVILHKKWCWHLYLSNARAPKYGLSDSAPKFELSVQGREGAGFFGRKTREFERSTLHSVRNKYEKKPILVERPA